MKGKLKILLLADAEAIPEEDPQLQNPTSDMLLEAEYHIYETLVHLGHDVCVLRLLPPLPQLITEIQDYQPELVFNLTEHYKGSRSMDMHVASLLDMLGYPYTGSGPIGLAINRDKGMCKRILGYHRIHVPAFFTVAPGRKRIPANLPFPMIVKPALEDGSDGISLASVVHSPQELKQRIDIVHSSMQGPAICEQFIEGRELYVTVLGNGRLQVLPARELKFGDTQEGPFIATARVKQDHEYRKKWNIQYAQADLPSDLEKKLSRICRKAYASLQLRDYGRIDARVTGDGNIYILEANPNPDLTFGDEVASSAEHASISYSKLIDRIVRYAMKRSLAAS